MSITVNVSAAALQQGTITSSSIPVNNISPVPTKSGVALQDTTDEDPFEAHMRQRTSPKDYFYAKLGAFAEGTYTEF